MSYRAVSRQILSSLEQRETQCESNISYIQQSFLMCSNFSLKNELFHIQMMVFKMENIKNEIKRKVQAKTNYSCFQDYELQLQLQFYNYKQRQAEIIKKNNAIRLQKFLALKLQNQQIQQPARHKINMNNQDNFKIMNKWIDDMSWEIFQHTLKKKGELQKQIKIKSKPLQVTETLVEGLDQNKQKTQLAYNSSEIKSYIMYTSRPAYTTNYIQGSTVARHQNLSNNNLPDGNSGCGQSYLKNQMQMKEKQDLYKQCFDNQKKIKEKQMDLYKDEKKMNEKQMEKKSKSA